MQMQTLATDNQFILAAQNDSLALENVASSRPNTLSGMDKRERLQAIYRCLFKDNRNIDFHHNQALDSAYLNNTLTTQAMVRELICSDMFVNYILATNSNYRFVQLCFERVLGRPAIQSEVFQWSSLLASEGIKTFAECLTFSDEYMNAFGLHQIPHRRSLKLFSSDQNLPALPKELSLKRYQGKGNLTQFNYTGPVRSLLSSNTVPSVLRRIGGLVTVTGAIAAGYMLIAVGL
ncbi:phycobilisome linker polypeptide [Leptolyngbya sp. Heron Island J]|uniref:phycobilisome rod-core linker polypeptide n=1 Tax=Leptolyngbya sp. Heron Island J TaxID=1385935 RepID=UPI0003B9879A|nr:phycobilisome rod-core linker polypeptide [Leptolyngbya sp. Heron Island J]ESA33906.1 phycobilisome linker polypeptide [Leptolyngbya sp. Heron Island J]